MKVHVIEGNRMWLDGGSMFGHTPKALWEKWIPADSRNRIEIATRNLLLQTDDGKNILFDVGLGTFLDPKLKERYGAVEDDLLLQNLQLHNVKEEDIHAVVLSHLHFDHVGGLLSSFKEGANTLRFKNATYFVGKAHWNSAKTPHVRERASFIPHLQKLLEESGRLELVEGSAHPKLPQEITFHYSDGHTVGLMVSEIALPAGPLLYASDLIPGAPWVHLPTVTGYDRFPELLIDEKAKQLESLSRRSGKICFVHDPKNAIVSISKDQNGKFIII